MYWGSKALGCRVLSAEYSKPISWISTLSIRPIERLIGSKTAPKPFEVVTPKFATLSIPGILL